jgi:hypothetical protein
MPPTSGRREDVTNRAIDCLGSLFGRLWDRSRERRLANWEEELPSLGKEVSDITKKR